MRILCLHPVPAAGKARVQVCSLTPLSPNNDERRPETGRRPCDDAHRRANTPAGNLQRRVFPLSHYGFPRHPSEGVPYAILQIWKNAAPVITVAHRVNRRVTEVVEGVKL